MDAQRIRSDVAWLAERAAYFSLPTNSTSAAGSVFQAGTNTTTTAQFIWELQFATAKSIRTSTIILAAFNAIAAFATASGILYEAYAARKRRARRYRASSRPPPPFVKSSELYPLILSCGITIQGIIFSVAQAQGLDSLLSVGCRLVSQFMLPAVFSVPFIQVVFGIEFALRGLRAKPFAPRAKYALGVCLGVIGLLLFASFLVADLVRTPDFCFASLFWFVAIYARGCFGVLLAIDIVLVLCTVTIFVQLTRSTKVETVERIAASRMVYYLALAILSNTLIIPLFFSLGFRPANQDEAAWNTAITLSMVASVVANVSGLMTGGLHLFLRSNTVSTIGPRDKTGELERRRIKGSIRRYNGGSEPDFAGHMMGPVGSRTNLRRMQSDASLISTSTEYAAKEEEAGIVFDSRGAVPATYEIASPRPSPLRSNAFLPQLNTTDAAAAASVRTPEPAQMSASSKAAETAESPAPEPLAMRITPASPESPENTESLLLLPATTYAPGSVQNFGAGGNGRFDLSSLKPPPSMNNLALGHQRNSSVMSSATVQIGLRLSNVDGFCPMGSHVLDKKVYTLDSSTPSMIGPFVPPHLQQPPPPLPREQEESQPLEILLAPTVFTQQRPSSSSSPSPPPLMPLPVLPPPSPKKLSPAPFLALPSSPSPMRRPSPLSNTDHLSVSSSGSGSEELPVAFFVEDDALHCDAKVLPPAPLVPRLQTSGARESTSDDDNADDVFGDNAQLSPSVYSALNSPTLSAAMMAMKLPSPRGVGFATVSRSNSSAALRTLAASNSGLARSPSAAAVLMSPRTQSPVSAVHPANALNVTSAPRSSDGNDMPDKNASDWI